MGVRDGSFDRGYFSVFIPAKDLGSVAKLDTVTPEFESFTASNPQVENINSTAVTGVKMTTDGLVVRHAMPLPPDWDYSQDIYVRLHWTANTVTAADGVTWKVLYELLAQNAALTGTIAAALDTVIARDAYGTTTAFVWKTTPWGKLAKNTIDPVAKMAMLLEVKQDTATITGGGALWLLGVEFYVAPKLDFHPGKTSFRAAVPTDA